jgi:hypothetical protein
MTASRRRCVYVRRWSVRSGFLRSRCICDCELARTERIVESAHGSCVRWSCARRNTIPSRNVDGQSQGVLRFVYPWAHAPSFVFDGVWLAPQFRSDTRNSSFSYSLKSGTRPGRRFSFSSSMRGQTVLFVDHLRDLPCICRVGKHPPSSFCHRPHMLVTPLPTPQLVFRSSRHSLTPMAVELHGHTSRAVSDATQHIIRNSSNKTNINFVTIPTQADLNLDQV